MIHDENRLKQLVIKAASQGCNKKSVIEGLKKIPNLSEKKINFLIKDLNINKKPLFVNHQKFYNTKISSNAKRIPFPFTKIYIYEDFLKRSYCNELISIADEIATKSSISNNTGQELYSQYRTSKTAYMDIDDNEIVKYINERISNTINLDPKLGGSLQIQKYKPGEYYRAHNDYYHWFTPEHKIYTEWMGQRTWTFMIYLNDVIQGGETYFKHLNLKLQPRKGMAVIWNNLFPFGIPNYKTLHEALPPISGNKYVITKWFRSWKLFD
tara:strand:+ start:1078 stop:1881 length:804 start_codon:yes stop_codon:yes gene_type:complete